MLIDKELSLGHYRMCRRIFLEKVDGEPVSYETADILLEELPRPRVSANSLEFRRYHGANQSSTIPVSSNRKTANCLGESAGVGNRIVNQGAATIQAIAPWYSVGPAYPRRLHHAS